MRFFIGTLTTAIAVIQLRADPIVIGYLPEYRIGSVTAETIKGVDAVIFFGIAPSADGSVAKDAIKAESLEALRAIRRGSRSKVLLCVGGWGRSTNFPAITADKKLRKRFISDLLKFCRDHGFDGVDYDWEHPKGATEMANYQHLLIESARAFHAKRLSVTAAIAGHMDLGKDAYRAIDRIHLMSYDQRFPQATLEASKREVNTYLERGCPAEKIALGVPFYGRNAKRDAQSYAALIKKHPQSRNQDIIAGFALNSPATLRKKLDFIADKKLSGIMIWELGQDSPNAEDSLLEVIRNQRK